MRMLCQLQHRNIVRLYGYALSDPDLDVPAEDMRRDEANVVAAPPDGGAQGPLQGRDDTHPDGGGGGGGGGSRKEAEGKQFYPLSIFSAPNQNEYTFNT